MTLRTISKITELELKTSDRGQSNPENHQSKQSCQAVRSVGKFLVLFFVSKFVVMAEAAEPRITFEKTYFLSKPLLAHRLSIELQGAFNERLTFPMLLGWHPFQRRRICDAFNMPIDVTVDRKFGNKKRKSIYALCECLTGKLVRRITPGTLSSVYILIYFLHKL